MLGDFNATPSNPRLTLYLENQNLKSMIKNPTCYCSVIDFILTNNSYLYQKKVSLLKQGLVIVII